MEGRSRSGAVAGAGVGLEWNLGHAKSEAMLLRRGGSARSLGLCESHPTSRGSELGCPISFRATEEWIGVEWSERGFKEERGGGEAVRPSGVADGRPAEVLDNDKSPRHCSALFPSGGRSVGRGRGERRDANKNAA